MPVASDPSLTTSTPALRPAAGCRRGRPVDWWWIVQALLLVLLPCACYWPAMDGEFLWDDEIVIVHSAQGGSLHSLWQIWFSTVPFDFYPLTNSFFWAQWHWWGGQPTGYHLVNLALHVAGAFLFWRLLRVLCLPGAWFAALLFAVHPVNVASVAWIAELKNVLSMVFFLASLICFVRWRERSGAAPGAGASTSRRSGATSWRRSPSRPW